MSVSELDRRVAEREAADRRYNDALTAVDRALPPVAPEEPPRATAGPDRPPLPSPPTFDPPPRPGGWRGRLAGFVWRTVAPSLARQQAWNEAAAAEAARAAEAVDALSAALDRLDARVRTERQAVAHFHSRLVQFLQQITPFIDTKTRVLDTAVDELRMAATSAQRSAVAARREIAQILSASVRSAGPDETAGAPAPPRADPRGAADYVGFEDLFRGSSEAIRARQTEDADRFRGASDVLDVGCGRGEFLDLLRERGVAARGIDTNAEMVEICRARGLHAESADALSYLERLPDASLGGLIAAQVVEHLEPAYLVRLLGAAQAKLRPGSVIVLETINVACWVAFFESYIRDLTHVRPLHPDTLKFLVVAAGFEGVDVHFRSPVDPSGRLQRAGEAGVPAEMLPVVRTFNDSIDRLNERLFTYLDYAVIGRRGE